MLDIHVPSLAIYVLMLDIHVPSLAIHICINVRYTCTQFSCICTCINVRYTCINVRYTCTQFSCIYMYPVY